MKRFLITLLAFVTALAPARIVAVPEHVSTVAERRSVNLTVYNAGTSLVHDRRRITLRDGVNQIAWRDVSANMDATSAILESLTAPGKIDVVEQNFDYDLLNPDALLQKYVGHYVTVVHDPRFAGERETRELAKVLSTNGGIVLQYRNRIETELRGHIAYPVGSSTFRDRPTLVLDLESARQGPETLDLSYMTAGLSWRADYIGVMAPGETRMSLTGLVTLTNNSGTSYNDARLQLVAGNVNIAQTAQGSLYGTLRTIANVTSMRPSQENFLEYHLYTMPHATDVLDKQTKQLTLLSAHDVPIHKTLELRGYQNYYTSPTPDLGDRLPIGVYVTFENRGGDLGIPLPGGIVRIYKNDSGGLSQFAGSDTIQHTPRNDTVRLNLGQSFDVTARKRQTDFQHVSFCSVNSSYEIMLSNAKSIPQTVDVVELIPNQWQILDENLPHKKTSATTATWSVPVPADGHATLTYTARVSWCAE